MLKIIGIVVLSIFGGGKIAQSDDAMIVHADCKIYATDEREWYLERDTLEQKGYHLVRESPSRLERLSGGSLILTSNIEDGRLGPFCLKGFVKYEIHQLASDPQCEPVRLFSKSKYSIVPLGMGARLVKMLRSLIAEMPSCILEEVAEINHRD